MGPVYHSIPLTPAAARNGGTSLPRFLSDSGIPSKTPYSSTTQQASDQLLSKSGGISDFPSVWLNQIQQVPGALKRGLTGNPNLSKNDIYLLKKLNYWLTGPAIILLFRGFGGHQQKTSYLLTLGASLFYATHSLFGYLADRFVEHRYGVNLGLKYKDAKGNIQRVFDDMEQPRFDLLTPGHYEALRRKMGMPKGLADLQGGCNENISRILHVTQVVKSTAVNLVAACVASFFTFDDAWDNWFDKTGENPSFKDFRKYLRTYINKDIPEKLRIFSRATENKVVNSFRDRLSVIVPIVGAVGAIAWGVLQLRKALPQKVYQASPLPKIQSDLAYPSVQAIPSISLPPSQYNTWQDGHNV